MRLKIILPLFLSILFILSSLPAVSQLNLKDSAVNVWFLHPSICVQFPEGDMKERFYINSSAGFGIFHKRKSNWLFGVEFNYLFAEKVRNEDAILSNISTSEGFVIDKTGVFANIHFRQRGFMTRFKCGKVITTRYGNPNSGVLVVGGFGMLQHRIRIEVHENTAPQLDGDYKKGYDKLTNGPAGSLFLGYTHFSDNKLINFSLGIEYILGFTKSRRDYDFVLMKKDETQRLDHLISLRFAWKIPVYRRAPRNLYTN